MAIRFFGQYLLEQGMINSGQLLEALEYQRSNNMRFGEYALKRGWITQQDLDRLVSAQKRMDKKIGELAVMFKILEPGEVTKLLFIQQNNNIMIGEALLEKGAITKEQLDEQLMRFMESQRDYLPTEEGEHLMPEDVADPEALRHMTDLTVKMLERVANMKAKAAAWHPCSDEPEPGFAFVSVRLSGDVNYEYALLASRDATANIAAGMLGSKAEGEPDEILTESAKEFCNLVCGNFRSMLRSTGRDLAISFPTEIPVEGDRYRFVSGRKALKNPIAVNLGDVTIYMVEGA